MKKCVIFDANFLYENKDFQNLLKNKKDDEEFFVTDLVINEIKSRNDRALRDMFDKFDDIVKSNLNNVYFKLKNNLDINKIYQESSKKIQDHFETFFDKNIIYGYSKENMYDELMERVRFKKAPFFDQENSSDKGFKDTLLWMSIINYSKDSKYDDYIIVTNDRGFLKKQKENLVAEFKDLFPNKNINIINNIEFDKIHSDEENKKDTSKEIDNPIINNKSEKEKRISDQLISEYRDIVYKFFNHTVGPELYSQDEYDINRFVLEKRPDAEDVIDFISMLVNIKDDYIFHDSVNIVVLFSNLGYHFSEQRENIPIKVFNNFVTSYLNVKNDYPSSLDAFVHYCVDNFCEVKYIDLDVDEEDLPF